MRRVLASFAVAVSLSSCALFPSAADVAFDSAVDDFIAWHLEHHPIAATPLGVHDGDGRLDDRSAAARSEAAATLHRFLDRFERFTPDSVSGDRRQDLPFLTGVIRSQLLDLEVVRPFARDPDTWTASVAQSVFDLIKRDFAPLDERVRSVIARERAAPAFLACAKQTLENPPRILTEVAIEQIDGTRDFFAKDVPLAVAGLTDAKLRAEFDAANAAVVDAFEDYKKFLVDDLLPRSTGSIAIGEDAWRRKLAADEGIDLPVDRLLAIADADLKRNQAAFIETAKRIDPSRPAVEVFEALSRTHPPADRLLAQTQSSLDAIRAFLLEKKIIAIPDSPPAKVVETPPFQRSTTSASMETPGPFEAPRAREAYYYMTLPDPNASAADREEFMRQWYDAMISNVSVHEAYPGHYIQFLYAPGFPTRVRKIFAANTNVEGWAHYCEQMMLDEGFHDGDPAYRLAQLQDALLRDARFVVGIRMHTRGMSYDDAKRFFETEAYQPEPVAVSESKRGVTDALYGYYTLGKLMILKLRDDWRGAHPNASIGEFHNAFIRLGPLPLPQIREAMLGSRGALLP